uniref:Uncharacterized protein n=1 Tax=Glossina pallidipes TaxID=7398 RepID=A0A1A9ZGN0_GLOPL
MQDFSEQISIYKTGFKSEGNRNLGSSSTQITIPAPIPQQAATANILNTAEPTIVPTPISPSVMKVPITFTNNSGAEVAAAINVAPATSLDIFKAKS